jgi:hypothetical protein
MQTAFKENAHTEVVTDLLVVRKPDGRKVGSEPWMSVEKFVGKESYYGEPFKAAFDALPRLKRVGFGGD